MTQYLTVDQAAQQIGCSRASIYRLVKDKLLSGEKQNRQLMIDQQNVMVYSENQKKQQAEYSSQLDYWMEFLQLHEDIPEPDVAMVITRSLIEKVGGSIRLYGQNLHLAGESRLIGTILAKKLFTHWKILEEKGPIWMETERGRAHVSLVSLLTSSGDALRLDVETNLFPEADQYSQFDTYFAQLKPGITVFATPDKPRAMWYYMQKLAASSLVVYLGNRRHFHLPEVLFVQSPLANEDEQGQAVMRCLDFHPDILAFDSNSSPELILRAAQVVPVLVWHWEPDLLRLVTYLGCAAKQLQGVLHTEGVDMCQIKLLVPSIDYRIAIETDPIQAVTHLQLLA